MWERLHPWIGPRWPLVALAASLAMLGAAHAFQRFADLSPCALCLTQREVYWWAAGLAAVAGLAALRWRDAALVGSAALSVAFAAGVYWAGFHAGAEQGFWPAPKTCALGAGAPLAVEDLLIALDTPQKIVRCDEIAWSFLGLSMAGWNLLISFALAAASVAAALSLWSKRP